MTCKVIFLVMCAAALFVQFASSQYLSNLAAPCGLGGLNGLGSPSLSAPGLASAYGAGCGYGGVASSGGGLAVTSVSPIAPTGITVKSENAFEGTLAANGNLPFLATAVIEGALPTAGSGVISYGCGNSAIGIAAEEGPITTGIAGPGPYPTGPAAGVNPSLAGIGYNGFAGAGYNGLGGVGYNGLAGAGYNGLAGIVYNGLAGVGTAGSGYGSNGCGCTGV